MRKPVDYQPRLVRFWHIADLDAQAENVCFSGVKQTCLRRCARAANDPTRTSAKGGLLERGRVAGAIGKAVSLSKRGADRENYHRLCWARASAH